MQHGEAASRNPARVLLVEDDPTTQATAASMLRSEGFEVDVAASCVSAIEAMARCDADAVILDIRLDDGSGLDLIGALRHCSETRNRRMQPPPVIVILSVVNEFATKLESVVRGADAYFEKPADWVTLVRKLRQLLARRQSEVAQRVLVVEDDPVECLKLDRVLRTGGFDPVFCSDPSRFEEVLRETLPDMILLDIHLGSVAGFELARFLRLYDRYAAVPIMFISGDGSEAAEIEALRAGGDGLLRKPLDPHLLLETIRARLGRARNLEFLLRVDPLSGLLSRGSIDERISSAMAEKRRSMKPFTLVVLDLDHFKAVNDTHGHGAGDRVIASLGRLLRENLRRTDSIGRQGGEEFAIVLPDTSQESASELMQKLLDDFSAIEHEGDDGTRFHVSFSAGVALLLPAMALEEWKVAADTALYEAKRSGRAAVRQAAAPELASPRHDHLDLGVLREIADLGHQSGTDLLNELIALFVAEIPRHAAAVRDAAAREDLDALARAAHPFCSASGNIGATHLSLACEGLETAARAGKKDLAVDYARQVLAEIPLVESRLLELARTPNLFPRL